MKKFLQSLIRLYQLSFSMLVGRSCRYLPTCSDYTMEAIEKHGSGRGILMGTARICRCHPWGQDGFDPVPQIYEGPVWKMKKGDQANT
jgi:uncharacterized protein